MLVEGWEPRMYGLMKERVKPWRENGSNLALHLTQPTARLNGVMPSFSQSLVTIIIIISPCNPIDISGWNRSHHHDDGNLMMLEIWDFLGLGQIVLLLFLSWDFRRRQWRHAQKVQSLSIINLPLLHLEPHQVSPSSSSSSCSLYQKRNGKRRGREDGLRPRESKRDVFLAQACLRRKRAKGGWDWELESVEMEYHSPPITHTLISLEREYTHNDTLALRAAASHSHTHSLRWAFGHEC